MSRPSEDMVADTIHTFNQAGLQGLIPQPKGGRPAKLTAEWLKRLLELVESDPRDLGYDFSSWTAGLLAKVLVEQMGMEVSESCIRRTLHQQDYTVQRPVLTVSSPWGGDPQFAIPWWQTGVDYTASKGSTTVRNAPDVSIVAQSISVFSNGSWTGFGGTSAAAPLWAGFMALANEQAAASGRPRVGFANPALWAIGRGGNGPTCFHDTTTGNNFNSTNPNLYSAVAGYDLCTGWGTPNGQDLIDALVGYSAGWGVLPGGGTTNLADAVTVFQNKIYLFGIGINDHQHYMKIFP